MEKFSDELAADRPYGYADTASRCQARVQGAVPRGGAMPPSNGQSARNTTDTATERNATLILAC